LPNSGQNNPKLAKSKFIYKLPEYIIMTQIQPKLLNAIKFVIK